jgi:O-antigen ligase
MVLWHCVRSTAQIRRLISFLAANAIIAAIVGSYFRLSRSELILGYFEPVHPNFFASFRYHNHWTAFALLSLGLCGALAFYWNRRARRDIDLQRRRPDLIWFAGLLVLSFTLPLTTARAGVLFLALFWLGLAVWFVYRALRPSKSGRSRSQRRYVVWLVPCFAIGLVAFSLWGARQGLLGEWQQTLNQYEQFQDKGFAEIDFARTDSWGDGWRMVRDRPYFGWGFGSHRYLYQIYARDQYRYESGVVEHIKEFAHNDWMQYLAELGFIGFTLLLIPPIYLTCRLHRSILREPFALALLFPCGLVLLLATFEFPLSNPAVLLLFSIQGILGFKYAALTGVPASAAPE